MRRFPEAYKTRFGAGEMMLEEGRAQIPVFDALYPGEVAQIRIFVDQDTNEVKYETVIECAPGLSAMLQRLTFRLFRLGHIREKDVAFNDNMEEDERW